MKKKKLYKVLMLTGLTLSIGITSCKKFIRIDAPQTQAEESRVFSDDQTATSATVGLYAQILASNLTFCNGGITVYAGLSADEFGNVSPSVTPDAFRTNSLLSDNTIIASTFWSSPYKDIYQANAVLEGLSNSTTLSPSVKQQLQGEMLFIRALHYFYMVNLFGDVPLETSTDYNVNSLMPRTSSAKVYQQLTADLIQAKALLTESYASSVNTRPTKAAATALLARVYLFQNNWTEALAAANEVITSGQYHLETLNNIFLSGSNETIFQLTKATGNTAEGAAFIPSSGSVKPTYAVTSYLLGAFESGDNRKSSWLKSNTVSGQQYYYPYKYKVKSSSTVTESYVVQRLAEVYLIRAEAKAQLDDLSGAIDDIDMIRSRAGLPKIRTTNPGISKSDLLTAVLKERQTELFAEWGHRWLDLKRTGKADSILGVIKAPNWQSSDQLYPIPFTEIQKNTALIQNAGYPQ